MLLRVGALPDEALAALGEFHTRVLPDVMALLKPPLAGEDHLTFVFLPADHTHRGWRLAVVQELARKYAPMRVNALASDDELAIAAAHAYLASAPGVTGQLLPLDGAGAGEVVTGKA